MKKKLLRAAAFLAAAVLAYSLLTGCVKNTSCFPKDWSVSENGREMTLRLSVGSSAGHIRRVRVREKEKGRLCLDVYAAFGGLNGRIGARNVFTVPLGTDTERIALCRDGGYEDILYKTEDGSFKRTAGG